MEEKLWYAARDGNEAEVRKILKENEAIKINWKNENQFDDSALHVACCFCRDVIVTVLLTHPDIDVNQKNNFGCTPFLRTLINGKTCVQLLLKDARVNPNEPDEYGSTPLKLAARYGHLDVIKWWIASGREMNLGEPGNQKNDAIGVARKEGSRTAVVSLLERFKEDPEETRRVIRIEVSWFGEMAKIFALVVFLSDGLLEIKRNERAYSKIARFFRIAKDLPMELQMVLCSRSMGSMKTNILTNESELAFKDLTKKLLWPEGVF